LHGDQCGRDSFRHGGNGLAPRYAGYLTKRSFRLILIKDRVAVHPPKMSRT
jgi:hypothetical protein